MTEMSGPTPALDRLDDAVRAHVAGELDPGEIVVSWIVVAATRLMDGGGHVIVSPCGGVMPPWEAHGLLGEALASVGAGS